MNFLYNTGIALYSAAAHVAALRSKKVSDMIEGQKLTESLLRDSASEHGFDVWFHAASLGEFEQARPMIERIRLEHPQWRILLSFFSPSGFNVRKNYDKVDAVVYLPFDRKSRVRKFLDIARPKRAIFVKYEFWGNFLQELNSRNIPTYIISAIFRPSQVFFKPWGGSFRKILQCFTHIYVQDDASSRLLAGIGVDRVTVAGDTRFDRVTDVMKTTFDMPIVEQWARGDQPPFTVIAGSSWPADEQYYVPWLNAHPEVRAIIAPHEFDDHRIQLLRSSLKVPSALFTDVERDGKLSDDTRVLIVNCFGKLSSLYRYGDVAIIGGGFGAGIHNINEAAVYGVPVVFGPNHSKFKEAADLIACGGGFTYSSGEEISAILDTMLHDASARRDAGKSAGEYISSNIGATDKIYNQIFEK